MRIVLLFDLRLLISKKGYVIFFRFIHSEVEPLIYWEDIFGSIGGSERRNLAILRWSEIILIIALLFFQFVLLSLLFLFHRKY